MCDPVSAMMAAQSAVKFAGEASATKAYNTNAAAAHRDAGIAASNKYGDIQRRFNYDAKATNQEGYRAALKARSEAATGISSAGSAGIAGGSITLANLEAMSRQMAAENESRVRTKREDLQESFIGQGQSIEAEARGRIASLPFKAGPSPLNLAINMASAGINAGMNADMISPSSNFFGGVR